ncbi:hypothetical protein BVRB_8g188950 [Beta vulgaris subsp. vulgaris]|nr:hypothetical protein BVRB_8g188950 [Beta vulgaris subsp. vulgaris]
MEQLFGSSVAQGGLKFTPVQRPKELVYIPSTTHIHSSPLDATNVGNVMVDNEDVMSDNGDLNHNETNMEWQEVWNDSTPLPSPSPQSTEHVVKGSKRCSENDVAESSKSCWTESGSRKGGAGLLMEKLDTMVKVVTERNTKEMELMSIEAQTLAESSHTLVDSLAKLVSMPDLILGSPEFFFACTMIEDPQKRIQMIT